MDDLDAAIIQIFRCALSDAPIKKDGPDLNSPAENSDGKAKQPKAQRQRRSTVNLRRIHWQGLADGNVSKSVFSRSGSSGITDETGSPVTSPERGSWELAPEPVTQREVALLENLFLEKEAKKIEKKKKKEGPKVVKLLGVRRQNGVMIARAQFKDEQGGAIQADVLCEAVMKVQDEMLSFEKLQVCTLLHPLAHQLPLAH
jgi:hypothetical protein